MALLVFAALIVTTVLAIIWGTTAAALRQPHQKQVAREEAGCESGSWLTPTHIPMW